jgi:hypothetical protein
MSVVLAAVARHGNRVGVHTVLQCPMEPAPLEVQPLNDPLVIVSTCALSTRVVNWTPVQFEVTFGAAVKPRPLEVRV